MGFRFRRTIRIFKGFRINISKSGISTTTGRRGSSFTIGNKRSSVNFGIPGTGLSYRKEYRASSRQKGKRTQHLVRRDENGFLEGAKPSFKTRLDFKDEWIDLDASEKSRLVALILCLTLGWIGAHRFYVRKYGTGLLQLLTCGFGLIWTFIDFFLILFGSFTDGDGRVVDTWKNSNNFNRKQFCG